MRQGEPHNAHWEDGYAVDSKGNIVYLSIDCHICNNIIKTRDREESKKRFPICPFCGTNLGEPTNN